MLTFQQSWPHLKQAIFLYQLTIITTLKQIRLQFYTNFLASKKLFRCLICQNPMATRISVWTIDHHRTLWLVLSLVCLKRSSRYWKNRNIQIRITLVHVWQKTPCSIWAGFQLKPTEHLPADSSALSGPDPPAPSAVAPSAAAPSACLWQRFLHSCLYAHQLGCPSEHAVWKYKSKSHLNR